MVAGRYGRDMAARPVPEDRSAPETQGADALAPLRERFATSTRLWGGPAARHVVEPGYWHTLSGLASIDYNVAGVHDPDEAACARAAAAIEQERVPGLVMAAGPALGGVAALIEAGWSPIFAVPFMAAALDEHAAADAADPAVRRLGAGHARSLRALVAETFSTSEESARVAVPDEALRPADEARHHASPARYDAFGLVLEGELVSAVLASSVGETICLWAMATAPRAQRQGHGQRVLASVLAEARRVGATRALLLASAAGRRLYAAAGFEVLEHWQVWSKPRWVVRS